jgi:predicted negative regulator of RcsB-dependent stress response
LLMDTLTTEEQQIAAIKQWWKENGSSIVTGVVLGLAVLFGGKAWFAYQERNAQSASNIFAVMMNALQNGDALNAGEKAGMLLADYGSTPYAALGALALARVRVEEGQLDAARAQLQWVLDNSDSEVFRDIASLRLARVLIASGDLDAATAIAGKAPSDGAFEALFAEVRGDIQRSRGDLVAASAAYQQALAAMPGDSQQRELLQLKYADTLAASDAAAETAK